MPDKKEINVTAFAVAKNTPKTIDSLYPSSDAHTNAMDVGLAVINLRQALTSIHSSITIPTINAGESDENSLTQILFRDYAGKEEGHLRINFLRTHYQGNGSGHLQPNDLMGVDITKANVEKFVLALNDATKTVKAMATKLEQTGNPITDEEIVSGIKSAMKKHIGVAPKL